MPDLNPTDAGLSHKVAVYVPSMIGGQKAPALHRRHVRLTLKALARLFGGATAVRGTGAWVDPLGRFVAEKVAICHSSCCGATLEQNLEQVYGLAQRIGKTMRQQAVGVEVDGIFYLIYPKIATVGARA